MPRRGLLTYENALVLILGMTFGIVFFDRQAASNLMPFIQPSPSKGGLGLDQTQVGLIGAALSATWAISAYLVGLISDRTGKRKPILILCVLGFSLCSVISGLASNYPMLIGARLFMGLLEGGVMPICLAIMTMESSQSRRGLNAGIVQNGFSNLVGNAAGPVVLVAIATTAGLGWRDAFFLSGIPGLLCALAIWLWVKEPDRFDAGAGGHAIKHLNLFEMLKVRNVLVCSLVSIFMVSWLITGFNFLPLYLVQVRGLTPTAMSHVMFALGICAFIGGALVPALSDRVGRKPVLIAGCFLSVIGPMAMLWFHGPTLILATILFFGWVGNCVFPMFMGTIPGESLPRASLATAMGIVVGVGEILGGVCGPTIAGWLADHTSLGRPAEMYMMIACAVIAGVIALFLKETAPAKVGGIAIQPVVAPVA
ncbi:MAG TPA: MFS transporter [Caulobacteraceae bacterium]